MGATPPFDHPHVFIDMGDETRRSAPIARRSTLPRPQLGAARDRPAGHLVPDAGPTEGRSPAPLEPIADHRVAGAGLGGLSAARPRRRRLLASVSSSGSRRRREAGAGIQLTPNAGRVLAALGLEEASPARCLGAARPSSCGAGGRRRGSSRCRSACASPAARPALRGRSIAPISTDPSPSRLHKWHRAFRHLIPSSSSPASARACPWPSHGRARRTMWSSGRPPSSRGGRRPVTAPPARLREPRDPGRAPGRARPSGPWPAAALLREIDELWLGPRAHVVPIRCGAADSTSWPSSADDEGEQDWSDPCPAEKFLEHVSGGPGPAGSPCRQEDWRALAVATVVRRRPWPGRRVALSRRCGACVRPFVAQGGAIAIEDAAVLARCHDRNPSDDIAGAIGRYEASSDNLG